MHRKKLDDTTDFVFAFIIVCVPFSPPLPWHSFIPSFLFVLSGSPLVVRLHRLGRVVVYVATSLATARGYLPVKAVGLV